MKEEVKCDLCGEIITGTRYEVYNENYQLQIGLVSCGCQYEEQEYIKTDK